MKSTIQTKYDSIQQIASGTTGERGDPGDPAQRLVVQAPRLAPDPGTAGLNVRDLHPPQNDVTSCTVIENKTSTFDDTMWQIYQ